MSIKEKDINNYPGTRGEVQDCRRQIRTLGHFIYALTVTEGCQPSEEGNGARGNDGRGDTGTRDCDEFKEFTVICHSAAWLVFLSLQTTPGQLAVLRPLLQISTLASPFRLSAQRTPVLTGR